MKQPPLPDGLEDVKPFVRTALAFVLYVARAGDLDATDCYGEANTFVDVLWEDLKKLESPWWQR